MLSEENKLKLRRVVSQRLKVPEDSPDLLKLSLEQLEFITHPLDKSSFLEACPGSGKTEVVGLKAAYELSDWQDLFRGLAILTFTRNAATEIKNRVIKYAGVESAKHPHFIGTFDSWMHSYLLQPFVPTLVDYEGKNEDRSIRIVDPASQGGFLSNYQTVQKGITPIDVNKFYWNSNNELESIERYVAPVLEESYRIKNTILLDQLKKNKKKFITDGFATYQDAEFLCQLVLRKKNHITHLLSRRFPYIIIDECQDLSKNQLALLGFILDQSTIMHFVGDIDQAIYEFRKVDPAEMKQFASDHHFICKALTNNFRSNQVIVDLCQKIAKQERKLEGCEPIAKDPAAVLWQYTNDSFQILPTEFKKLIEQRKLDPNKCAIVARGKTTLHRLHPQNGSSSTAVELFAHGLNCWHGTSRNTEDISNAINQIGRCLSYLAYNGKGNHQKDFCPEEIGGVEWRLLLRDILFDASFLYPFHENGTQLNWSQWVVKLKKFLKQNWEQLPFVQNSWEQASTKVRAPSGMAKDIVEHTICLVPQTNALRTSTIHSVKGETLDAVLLVSHRDKRSQGGHFEHWLNPDPGEEEFKRFAYVACSRPKHLLVIATPVLTKSQLDALKDIGLEEQTFPSPDMHT